MNCKIFHDPTNKTLQIPRVALQLSGLAEKEKMELLCDQGCVLLLPEQPSASELLSATAMLMETNIRLLTRLAEESRQAMPDPPQLDMEFEKLLAESGVSLSGLCRLLSREETGDEC